MLWAKRKTRTYRRTRAQEARVILDRYRRELGNEARVSDLAELCDILANLANLETNGSGHWNARVAVSDLSHAAIVLRELVSTGQAT